MNLTAIQTGGGVIFLKTGAFTQCLFIELQLLTCLFINIYFFRFESILFIFPQKGSQYETACHQKE